MYFWAFSIKEQKYFFPTKRKKRTSNALRNFFWIVCSSHQGTEKRITDKQTRGQTKQKKSVRKVPQTKANRKKKEGSFHTPVGGFATLLYFRKQKWRHPKTIRITNLLRRITTAPWRTTRRTRRNTWCCITCLPVALLGSLPDSPRIHWTSFGFSISAASLGHSTGVSTPASVQPWAGKPSTTGHVSPYSFCC